MNAALYNCLIEKQKLQSAIREVSATLQQPKFWDADTYRVIPYNLVRKVDQRIQEAKDLIEQFDKSKITHDEGMVMMYNAALEMRVLKYLIEDECLVSHT